MKIGELLNKLGDSEDVAAAELVAELRLVDAQPLPSSARESARSLGATFAARATRVAAAGIGSSGIDPTVARLNALPADEPILLFHFTRPNRSFSVFVRELDHALVGVMSVDRVPDSGLESFLKANTTSSR